MSRENGLGLKNYIGETTEFEIRTVLTQFLSNLKLIPTDLSKHFIPSLILSNKNNDNNLFPFQSKFYRT